MWKNVEQVVPLITKLFQKLKPSGIKHWPISDASHQTKILNKSTAGEIPGTGSSKQRRTTSCRCSPSVNPKSCPLTAYLLYGTHPAFKTLHSSLSVFKKKRANSVKLPFPKWFVSDSGVFYRNLSDMPSSAIVEDQSVVESPSKRKLSSPASSPQKKLAKLDEAKMPSSVTSSPLKESTALNKSQSPVKKLNLSVTTKVPKLQIAKLTEKAHVPTRGSQYAAGYDLKSAYEYTVPKRGSCLIKTDIQIKLPEGTYGRVAPRSGLALKNKIDVGAGVIDQDYRGNVGVILFNHGDEDFTVAPGDRVAQLICEKIEYPEIEEVMSLDETERGEGGFGSTGIKSA